ncbi:MAG TPA: exodeoxyribonuclease VII large subunit [Dissulfurispiraceae bacterium]|nr:exodeoxyribonuclease VII large subunit [Dissulfurispiraceae bacterium]
MEQLSLHKPALTLFELNSLIRSAINNTLPDLCWVVAEIAESKCNQKGHCYLDLIEKEDDRTIAQIRATIWSYEYRTLSRKFESATKTPLRQGMKVLFLAAVTFHEVYGLSLNIKDIDPAYTMGEMALRKREIVERLKKEGIIDRNKELSLPIVPQRIAVISSPTAAGYGDFLDQLHNNPYGFKFSHTLFPALMQGEEAERSVVAAFDGIVKMKDLFDVAVIIRGGGSVADLSCFDNYPVASMIARCPLPVITGIGHEKDDTVADIVAHTRLKTPTAVAEFLISGTRSFEERLIGIENRLRLYSDGLLSDAANILNSLAQRLSFVPFHIIAAPRSHLGVLEKGIKVHVTQYMQRKQDKLSSIEQTIRLLDPVNVMKRGYSITTLNGKAVRDATGVGKGDVLETQLYRGIISSIVTSANEDGGQGR